MSPTQEEDWFVCPSCGEVLVGDPTSCDRCGADDEGGWAEDTADGLDLPTDFDYEETLRDEGLTARERPPLWMALGVLAALAALAYLLLSCQAA